MPGDAWEHVAEGLERVAVPGGWLYRTFHFDNAVNDYRQSAPCFVATPTVPAPASSDRCHDENGRWVHDGECLPWDRKCHAAPPEGGKEAT